VFLFAFVATIPRAGVQLAQCAPQLINLTLVSQLLTLGEFHQFEHFFHLVLRLLQRSDDLHHVINRLMNRRHGRGLERRGQRFATRWFPARQLTTRRFAVHWLATLRLGLLWFHRLDGRRFGSLERFIMRGGLGRGGFNASFDRGFSSCFQISFWRVIIRMLGGILRTRRRNAIRATTPPASTATTSARTRALASFVSRGWGWIRIGCFVFRHVGVSLRRTAADEKPIRRAGASKMARLALEEYPVAVFADELSIAQGDSVEISRLYGDKRTR
jgi:hypothetical protein